MLSTKNWKSYCKTKRVLYKQYSSLESGFMGNKESQSWTSTLSPNQITPVALGNVNSKTGVMLSTASGSQSWHLAQVMNPDVTFCGDECSALFIPQIITFLTHRKAAVSRGKILSTLLRIEAWGCYGASPAQVRRHQKSPRPLLFTLLGWDWPKLGLWELDLRLFAHRARAELCRKVKKCWGICWELEPPAKLKPVQFSTFILELLHWNPLNSLTTLGKNTSLVKGKEKPKRSL